MVLLNFVNIGFDVLNNTQVIVEKYTLVQKQVKVLHSNNGVWAPCLFDL